MVDQRGCYGSRGRLFEGVRSSWISVKETSGVRAGMPLLPLSQAPTVCTSFGRWFRAALSPLLLGFQSVPLAFHHWDRHLVISCIPEQASIATPRDVPIGHWRTAWTWSPPGVLLPHRIHDSFEADSDVRTRRDGKSTPASAPVPRRLTGVDGHLFLAFRLFCKQRG